MRVRLKFPAWKEVRSTARHGAAGVVTMPGKPKRVLSPSQIRSYLDCQARWYYRYELHMPDPMNADRALGLAVHRAIEENFRHKLEAGTDIAESASIDVYRDAWKGLAEEVVWREGDDRADLAELGEVMMRVYMADVAPRIQPAAVEQSLEGEIAGVAVRGRLDILDVNRRVIDAKTAKKSPCGINPDYRMQVAMYSRMLPDVKGARVDTLVKARTVKAVEQSFDIAPSDIRQLNVMLPLVADGMESGLYMPNRNSHLCSRRYCAYWDRCQDEYGGEVKS